MGDELEGLTNGALVSFAANGRNAHELRLRAGRKAIEECGEDPRKLEKIYCDTRLPQEVRVEAGVRLVEAADRGGQDLKLFHLRNSPPREVAEAAEAAIRRRFGTTPRRAFGAAGTQDKAVAKL